MGKPRGGQRKHWAEQARIEAWYTEIKRCCGWSDYKLDNEFAWTEEGLRSRDNDYRPRTFEWIRKKSRVPRGVDKRWRNMNDLVLAVEQRFEGTQEIYNAEIWDLIQQISPTPEQVEGRISRLLAASELVRMPAEKIFKSGGGVVHEFDLPVIFDRCLLISLQYMDQFSRIALVWCLYLQTEPAHNAHIRKVVEVILDNLLDHFFSDFLPEKHLDYYGEAIGALFRSRLDLSARGLDGYGIVETLGTWPIIPKQLTGKLTKSHFVS